jgi:tubulin polyglutamylase TTLL4
MKRKFPNDYDFIPNTYLLSSDYERAKAAISDSSKNEMFILKPCNNACGRGKTIFYILMLILLKFLI